MSTVAPDPHSLRLAWAGAVLGAVARVHGIDLDARGADSALARALGVAPQQVYKARHGGRSPEWLARIAAAHRIAVWQRHDGTVEAFTTGESTDA